MFDLAERRFALPLADVAEVLRAVAITPLPGLPPVLDGVVNVRGSLVPVLNVRRRMGIPARPLDPQEHFILTNAGGRSVLLRVDRALGVESASQGEVEDADTMHPEVKYVAGVAKLSGGLAVIQDVRRFLSAEESARVAASIEGAEARSA